jgi:hypothetical protein
MFLTIVHRMHDIAAVKVRIEIEMSSDVPLLFSLQHLLGAVSNDMIEK